MSDRAASIDQFLDPPIGNPSRVQRFEAHLATDLDLAACGTTDRLYNQLRTNVGALLIEAASSMTYDPNDDTSAIYWSLRRDTILNNVGFSSAVELAIFRTVGDVFADKKYAPQTEETVNRAVSDTEQFIHSLAFASLDDGLLNVNGLRDGLSPVSPLTTPVLRVLKYVHPQEPVKMSRRSFKITKGDDRQLDIRPRFRMRRGTGICPAVHAKVAGIDHDSSAIRTYIGAIGNVVKTQIYPQQFDIAS